MLPLRANLSPGRCNPLNAATSDPAEAFHICRERIDPHRGVVGREVRADSEVGAELPRFRPRGGG